MLKSIGMLIGMLTMVIPALFGIGLIVAAYSASILGVFIVAIVTIGGIGIRAIVMKDVTEL